MAETIKSMWLKDIENNKIAPKTLSSQILNEDGTLFRDEIFNAIGNGQGSGSASVQIITWEADD